MSAPQLRESQQLAQSRTVRTQQTQDGQLYMQVQEAPRDLIK